MRTRVDVLRDLLEAALPIDTLVRELATFEWDSEQKIAVLLRRHIVTVLNDFLAGRRTAADICSWAEAIETRDDIGFEPGAENVVRDAIFTLANPALSFALSPLLAQKLLRELERSS